MSASAVEGGAPAAGMPVALEQSPYPYKAYSVLYRGTTAPDGTFAFPRFGPTQNTRLRVVGATGAASTTLQELVDPRVALAAKDLGPGRELLSLKAEHVPEAHPAPFTVRWYLAPRGSDVYRLAASVAAGAPSVESSYASVLVDPPARRFSYRVCLNPPWEAAMGPPAAHGPCPAHGFRIGAHAARARPRARAAFEFGGEARGTPLPAFPTPGAVASARRYLEARAGSSSFAIVDSTGRLEGWRLRAHFETASVVKVMFLTAYLQMLAARHRPLGAGDRALLYPMIHESNNDAASAVLAADGSAAVARVAREAGMQDYAPGVGWWAYTQTSAADQARFFTRLGRLIPARFYGYARYLMSTIEPEQSWGAPAVARPAWSVFFKTGQLPEQGLFDEAALLERGPLRFTLAVFTSTYPSEAYGHETIAGVAARLLADAP